MKILIVFLVTYLLSSDAFITRGVSIRKVNQQLSAGFGSKKSTAGQSEVLKITRKTQFRQVTGSYARLLATKAVLFEKMKNKQGLLPTYDLYVHASNSDIFWFVGKLIHDSNEMSAEEALYYEQDLIKEYAKSLRPADLSGPLAVDFELEIFTSPGNNEMNVAQNKIDLTKFTYTLPGAEVGGGEGGGSGSSSSTDGSIEEKMSLKNVPNMSSESMTIQPKKNVGFEPEVYEGGEEGFRVKRNRDGTPLKAAFEVMTQSPEQFAKMQQDKQANQ